MTNGNATALDIARDFTNLSLVVANIIGNPALNLSDAQADKLNEYNTDLVTYSDGVAIQTALNALAATADNLNKIKAATGAANAAANRMKADATKINSIIKIVGDAVSLGAAIVAGPLVGVLTATTTLASDASGH